MSTSLEAAFRQAVIMQNWIEKDNVAISIVNLRKASALIVGELQKALGETPAPHPDQHFGCYTFAQHGDDLMILNLFKLMGIENPTYLDLGAHHPTIISNTKLLYDRGSRGVNVEANPVLYEAFKIARPEDVNINVGVGVKPGKATFYMYSDTSGRNTFSPQEVDSLRGRMTVQRTVELPIVTLPEIVKDCCKGAYPDLLSCDIEGLDYDVLSQLPPLIPEQAPPQQPKLIVVETRKHQTGAMRRMLFSKGYVLYCRMGENLFFVQHDMLEFLK